MVENFAKIGLWVPMGENRNKPAYDICLSQGFSPGPYEDVKYMKTLHNVWVHFYYR